MTGSFMAIRIWCVLLLCHGAFSLTSSFLPRAVTVKLGSAQHPPGYKYMFDRYPPYVNTKFAILGGGAFSLALSKVLSHKNILCDLLVRNQSVAEHINAHHRHPKYLSDLLIPSTVRATTDPEEALKDANYIIHAVPMQESRSYLKSMKSFMKENVPILSVAKGIERNTCKLMSEIIAEELGEDQRCAFLSGPSFAREIMESQPTAVVIASTEASLAKELAEVLSCIEFRCHTSSDVAGVELGGAIKNVLAIAAGMCEGLGYGMNTMSSLITRGCLEMTRMGLIMGAREETFVGLSGVGDTFATCLGPLSRNRRVGCRLAKGEPLSAILESMDGVSEGVSTVLALEELIKRRVRPNIYEFKFPIMASIAQVIRGNITPELGLNVLMRYPIRDESRSSAPLK